MTPVAHDAVRVPMGRFRAGLAAMVRSVVRSGRPLVLTSSGRDTVALVPMVTLQLAAMGRASMPDVAAVTAGMPGVEDAAAALRAMEVGDGRS